MKNGNKLLLGLISLLTCGGLVGCGSTTYEATFNWKGIKATVELVPSNGGETVTLDATVSRSTEL